MKFCTIFTNNIYHKLLLLKIVTLLICGGLFFSGRHYIYWPFVTWPMYSRMKYSAGTLEYSDIVIKVITRESVIEIHPSDLYPLSHVEAGKKIIKNACNGNSEYNIYLYRTKLVELIRFSKPNLNIQEIQCWQLHWKVNPSDSPPLKINQPINKEMVGIISVPSYIDD